MRYTSLVVLSVILVCLALSSCSEDLSGEAYSAAGSVGGICTRTKMTTCKPGYSCECLASIRGSKGTCSCIQKCADECSPGGSRQCSGAVSYKACGNFDADTCLEWSAIVPCNATQVCSSGQCITNVTCTPATCAGLGKTCGQWPNGCGGTLSCGSCGVGSYCSNGQCIVNQTLPVDSCRDSDNGFSFFTPGYVNVTKNGQFNMYTDYCQGNITVFEYFCNGNQAQLANFTCAMNNAVCSGGACRNITCTPITCAGLGKTCGQWPNGCGGTLSCGSCGVGTYCSNGQCIVNQTLPNSCVDSDGGIVPYTHGYVNVTLNGQHYWYEDYCMGNYTLAEYYCFSSQYRTANVTCNASTYCYNGQCNY